MISNLHAVMTESPNLLAGYQKLPDLFSQASFDKNKLTMVWQTIDQAYVYHYYLPAHTMVAQTMETDMDINKAVYEGTSLPRKN